MEQHAENEQRNNEQVFQELKGILEKAMEGGEKLLETNEKIVEFAARLKAGHPDVREYLLFHLLVGSSPRPGDQLKFDLPDHEIERFIRSLDSDAKEYSQDN